MGILNNLFKFVEPAAGEILGTVARELLADKTKEEVKKDYIQPIIAQAVTTASAVAVNQLKKAAEASSGNLSEYEIAKREKYLHTF